ncbi:MAG: universal stress protein [Bacteroidetes bacterium]|nr:universal stress protein [Bacteroidota bacterium]
MYKLLIPFSYSRIPGSAVSFAVSIKKQLNCHIILLAFEHGDTNEAKQQTGTGSQKEQLLSTFPDIDEIVQADPLSSLTENIIEVCRNFEIDLLLLGGNPMKNQDHLIHQSTLETLYRELICPMLFIPGPIDIQDLSTITFYVSQGIQEQKKNMVLFRDLAEALNSKVHLLSVIKPTTHDNSQMLEELKQFADTFSFNNYSINTTYNASILEGIGFFKHKKRTSMVAVTTDKNNPQARLNLVKNLLVRFNDTIVCTI